MSSEQQYWSYRPESGDGGSSTPPQVYDPALPQDLLLKLEVVANGAYCGHLLETLATYWEGLVVYPLDFFNEDEDPIKIPHTQVAIGQDAEYLPILAFTVSADGQQAAAVVDLVDKLDQRSKYPLPAQQGKLTNTDCKVIGGKPSEILPPELLARINIDG